MPSVKIKVPVFSGGARIHKPDDIVELGVTDAEKYERRGWGSSYTPPKPEAKKDDGKKGEEKK